MSRLFQLLITTVPSLYKGAKDGEITGIIVENKHINRLEIDLECVIVRYRTIQFEQFKNNY